MSALPAIQAVRACGIPEAEVCRLARVSPSYLRQIAREGAPYWTALRLASVTRAPLTAFLRPNRADQEPARQVRQRRGAGRRRAGSPAGGAR